MGTVEQELEKLRKRRKSGASTSGSSSRIPTTETEYEIEKLKYQRDQSAAALGKKSGGEGKGLFGKVMDVLSRGAYASAEAVRRSDIGDLFSLDPRDAAKEFEREAKGAWAGLSGKKKTTYSQVLEEKGVKNKWVKGIGGFAGDVLLDPSTYVGVGLVGKGGKVAKIAQEAKGTKTVGDVAMAAKQSGALKEVAERARKAYYDEALAKGSGLKTEAQISSKAKKIGREAANQERERLLVEASKRLPSVEGRKLSIKFGGSQLGTISYPGAVEHSGLRGVLGRGAGTALSAPKKALAQTEFGQNLTELGGDLKSLISNKVALGPLAQSRKVFQGRSIAELDDWVAEYGWKEIPLKKSESEAFTHAYENGILDEFIASTGGKSSKGVDYEELAEKVRKANHDLIEHDKNSFTIDPENPKGIMKADAPEVENYLHHQYKNKGGIEAKLERKKSIAEGKKPLTIKEAKARELNPETDIRVIMMNRAGKSFSGQARGNYISDAIDQFGMKLDKKTLQSMKDQGHDLVNIKGKLKSVRRGEQDDFLDTLPDDLYVDRNMAKYLEAADKVYKTPEEFKRIVRLFDNIQNKLKAAQTVYNPGHHIRNFNTDLMLSYFDGVNSVIPYEKASRILWGGEKASLRSTKIGRQRISNVDLRREFKESGAAPGWMATNIDEGNRILKGKITRSIHKISQGREEYGRFAHWIHALGEEGKGLDLTNLDNLRAASLRAAERVRHWHIDYTDLTPFERTWMKRAIPYYTWMRHSTPLMLEAMATRPGKVATIPKGMNALETVLGLDPDDKLPVDMIPKWLRDAGAIQAGSQGDNPLFYNPSNPVSDTLRMGEGGVKGVMGNLAAQTTPFIRAPFELGTGRTAFGGGVPIKSTSSYLLGQVPISRNLSMVKENMGDPGKSDTWTRVLQYLTGAGLYEATPNRIKGELHRQIDPLQAELRKVRGR